jgi:hypothetical protein
MKDDRNEPKSLLIKVGAATKKILMDDIEYVEKYDRIQLWMRSGDCLLISKYRYAEFVKAYMDLLTRTNI